MKWVALCAVVATACTTTPSVTTTVPATSSAAVTTEASGLDVPETLTGFEVASLTIDGEDVLVAVADTPTLRSQGLRQVSDLGDLGGMLFVFGGPVRAAFTMRDTLIPLDLHHLDAGGGVLEIITMEPCDGPDCRFPASVDFHYSLETPAGAFGLSVGDTVGLPTP